MPLRLLVRAHNSPTFPQPGSWQKGEIVVAKPDGHVWGNLERPPDFVRCDLTFQNTPDPEWVNEAIEQDGGRRTIGVSNAEVDSILAADPVNGTRTYNNAGQFIQVLESK